MRRLNQLMAKYGTRLAYAVGVLTVAWPARVLAATAGGTVAHTVTTAAIVGTGIAWAFTEHGTGVRKLSGVAFGGAAALGATTAMTALFGAGALF